MFQWLWPIACQSCGEIGEMWCRDCQPGSLLCPPCGAPGIERAFAVERFDRALGEALVRAKAQADRDLADRLASVFAQRIAPILEPYAPSALVPAPSTLRTRFVRGFSVAALLARRLSQATGVPVVRALRSQAGPRLATLRGEQRKAAIRGRIRSRRLVPGRVVLVDDVLTTGATADACAAELLGGATERLVLATLCAVPRRHRSTPVRFS